MIWINSRILLIFTMNRYPKQNWKNQIKKLKKYHILFYIQFCNNKN